MEKNLFNKFRFYNFEMGARKNEFKSDFNRYLDNEKINYIHLIELLKKFAINNPKIQIIFRPHPRQDIELVKKRFGKKISNIKIIYEGVITPWIAACELYSFWMLIILNRNIAKKNNFLLLKKIIQRKQKCLENLDIILEMS